MKQLVQVLFLAIIAAVFLSACGAKTQNAPQMGDQLAYLTDSGLYLRNLTSGDVQLLTSETSIYKPMISPSGNYVAFQTFQYGDKLSIVTAKGEKIPLDYTLYSIVPGDPSYKYTDSLCWSGKADILYFETKDGALHSFDAEHKTDAQLTAPGNFWYNNLICAHDGEKLYYEKINESVPPDNLDLSGRFGFEFPGLFSWDIQTKAEKLVLASRSPSKSDVWGMSPSIAKLSNNDQWLYIFMGFFAASATYDGVPFGTINLRTGTLTQYMPALTDNSNVALMNDGKLILLSGDNRLMTTNKALTLIDANTGKSKQLTANDIVCAYPNVSPDNKHVVYSAFKAPPQDRLYDPKVYDYKLYIANIDSFSPVQLTNEQGLQDEYPIFLSDGKRILFLRTDANGKSQIWTINTDKSELKPLTPVKMNSAYGVWKDFMDVRLGG